MYTMISLGMVFSFSYEVMKSKPQGPGLVRQSNGKLYNATL